MHLDSFKIHNPKFYIGWLILDITEAVKHWQMDRRTNQGLHVEFLEKGTKRQIDPTLLGFTDTGSNSLSESFMLVYFNSLTDNVLRNQNKRDAEEEVDDDLESIGEMLEDDSEKEHSR